MRAFWAEADRIVRSTRLAHETDYDAERAAIAAEARERRKAEQIADGTLPDPTNILVPRS